MIILILIVAVSVLYVAYALFDMYTEFKMLEATQRNLEIRNTKEEN